MKQTAEHVFRHTLAAIDIPSTLARKLQRENSRICAGPTGIDLSDYREIVAIAFGKAAFAMADGLSSILAPEFPPDGILVVPALPPAHFPDGKRSSAVIPYPPQKVSRQAAPSSIASRAAMNTL